MKRSQLTFELLQRTFHEAIIIFAWFNYPRKFHYPGSKVIGDALDTPLILKFGEFPRPKHNLWPAARNGFC